MGAAEDCRTISAYKTDDQGKKCRITTDEVCKIFERLTDEARYDFGHSGYSGTIAESDNSIEFHETPFASEKDAMDWLADDPVYQDKWGPARAVLVSPSRASGKTGAIDALEFLEMDFDDFWIVGGWWSS